MLTLCAMTLRQADLLGKVSAAAAAGFPAVGVTVDDYLAARRQGIGDDQLRARIEAEGIRIVEIESPWDWTSGDAAVRRVEDAVFGAVEVLGCTQINVVQFEAHPADVVRAGLDRIAVRAERAGARIALEFMPFSRIRTLADAWQVVRGCEHPIDLVLDLWHLIRSGGTVAEVFDIPADVIASVQLNGVPEVALDDLKYEARHLRLLPDEGVLDVADVLTELHEHDVRGRLSVEVWSDELIALDRVTAARRAYDAVQRVLSAAALPTCAI